MFNPPSSVRSTLYVITVFINAMMLVFTAREVAIPVLLEAAISGLNAVVAVMAVANVKPDVE